MKVSMKQARRIEREIGAQLEIDSHGRDSYGGAVSISIYENFESKMQAIQEQTLKGIQTASELIRIRFAIRKAIETTNEMSGINNLMNQEAGMRSLAKQLTAAMTGELTADEYNIAKSRHEALKQSNEKGTVVQSRYGAETDALTVAKVLNTTTLNELRDIAKGLQRDLLRVVEELSTLNANSKVEIADEDVMFLEASTILV